MNAQDPSNPTQVTFHVMQEFEWTKLSDGRGDQVAYKISPFIPIKLFDHSFLANVEVPLTYAGTEVLGDHTDIGDTRLKFFWLIGTENELVTAVVPSLDAIAPTGDDELGTGGAWILMQNMVFALQSAKKLAMHPLFRDILWDSPQSFRVPESGIPIPLGGDVSVAADDTRAFNLEWMNVFSLEDAVMDWVTVTPDYSQNFTGNRSFHSQKKFDSGFGLADLMFLLSRILAFRFGRRCERLDVRILVGLVSLLQLRAEETQY